MLLFWTDGVARDMFHTHFRICNAQSFQEVQTSKCVSAFVLRLRGGTFPTDCENYLAFDRTMNASFKDVSEIPVVKLFCSPPSCLVW